MTLAERLRRFDDRVIGEPGSRPAHVRHKRSFLFGVVGTLLVLVLLALFNESLLLPALGAFVGTAIGGGVRWWRSAPEAEHGRTMRVLLGLRVLVIGAAAAGSATIIGWDEDNRPPFRTTPYQQVPPTMVVLCGQTSQGDAYTYQAPATDTPKCHNGAVPQVVVRP